MIRFIKDFPALFIEENKILTIADLHIGLQYELSKSGINIPSQIKKMKENIDCLLDLTKASTLVVLGDIKHKVPGMSWQEIKDIPELFEYLSSKVKVIVCKGNHDDHIEKIITKRVKIHTSKGFKIKNFGFIHGHAWPSKELLLCDCLISGHTHPTVQFTDKFGYRIIEPVWIKNKIDKEKIKERYKVETTGKLEFIIMPAFNRLLGGTPVNVKRNNDEILGPLLKNNFVDMNESEIYLLDGTYLGKLKNLIY
jgi:hypothetical protein